MMINLETLASVRLLLLSTMAYFLTLSLGGYFQALIITGIGDDTPNKFGFLTFNPLVHFSMIGFFAFLFSGYGWGKQMPTNPYGVCGPNRMGKIAILFFVAPIVYLVLTIAALTLLILLGGAYTVSTTMQVMGIGTSVLVGLRLVVQSFLQLNFLWTVIYFIVAIFQFLLFLFDKNVKSYSRHAPVMFLIVQMVLLLFFMMFLWPYMHKIIFSLLMFVERAINALLILFKIK